MNRNFTEILQEFLEENGFTRSEFARRIDVKPSQVSEWIYGKAKPGYDMIKRMAQAFNISADYFLGLKDEY